MMSDPCLGPTPATGPLEAHILFTVFFSQLWIFVAEEIPFLNLGLGNRLI